MEEPVDCYTQDNGPDYKGEDKLVGAEFQNKNFGFRFVVSGFWLRYTDTPIRRYAFRLFTLELSNPSIHYSLFTIHYIILYPNRIRCGGL